MSKGPEILSVGGRGVMALGGSFLQRGGLLEVDIT
jgi:hypothetical protein